MSCSSLPHLSLSPIGHLAVDRASSPRHALQVLLVDFEDMLHSIYSDIHCNEDWDHAQHGDPDTHKTLGLCFPIPV